MKRWLILLIVSGLVAACTTQPTQSVIVSLSPEPTATPEQPTNTPVPTIEPTSAVTATPSVLFPITWTVTETTSADGRMIYVVDDPDVIRAAQEGYERLREYYTFPNGLPSKEQIETDIAELVVDPDRVRGAVEQIEKWRESGGYWMMPPIAVYKWTDKAEFSEDGSQVSMTFTAELHHNEWFSLNAGTVTFVEDKRGLSADVTMLYNENTGLWKVLAETTTVSEKVPIATVTPAP